MGLMERGRAMLARRREQAAGHAATYTRGATSGSLTVCLGQQAFAVSAPEGKARVVWGDADFLFGTADLVAAGFDLPPRKGDRVTLTLAGEVLVFEAQTPTGETVWRFANPARSRVRLHAKRVG